MSSKAHFHLKENKVDTVSVGLPLDKLSERFLLEIPVEILITSLYGFSAWRKKGLNNQKIFRIQVVVANIK